MMNTNNDFPVKKKRFVYKSVIGAQKSHHNGQDFKKVSTNTTFPDDLSSVLSQPSKKPRLNLEDSVQKKVEPSKNGNINDIDFGDADNDFNDLDFAEIDQIEILASQQPLANKTLPSSQEAAKTDMLDELLGFSNSKQNFEKPKTFILPSSKSFLNHSTVAASSSSPSKVNGDLSIKANKKVERSKESQNTPQKNNFVNRNIEQSYQQQYNEAQRKANEYKTKLEGIEKKFNSKDGEIKILREKLRKSSEDEHKMKERILLLESSMKSQQSEKESTLLKEVDRLKTQLEFKEKEVHDSLEKQKQISRPKPSFQSPNRTSNVPDGFKNTKADGHNYVSKKDNNKVSSNSNQKYFSSSLKSCFLRNFKNYTSSNEIVIKLSKQSVNYSFSQQLNPKYSCAHNMEQPVVEGHKNELLSFVVDLQNGVEFVEQDGFFVPNFILKVNQYLKKLETLFQCQTEAINENQEHYRRKYHKQKLKGSVPDTCTKCDRLYEIGFKSLFVLKESCIVYGSVRKYLLDGFAQKQGNENTKKNKVVDKNNSEMIDGVEYFYKYPNKECSVLIQGLEQVVLKEDDTSKTNHEFAVQLWETLFLLRQNKMWLAALEDVFFEFYVHLLSHPRPCTATTSFLKYLAEKEVLSSYLNVITIERVLQVLQLLLNCSAIKEVTTILCSNSERCPLLAVYNVLLSIDTDDGDKMLLVFHKLVCLLLSLLAQEQIDAYPLLLDSSCQCSNDIIECLITFLFDEFKILRKKVFHPLFEEIEKSDRDRMTIFQSGIALLCKLSSNDKHLNEKRSAVEWSYFNLLTGTIKMYRKIPAISENEVIAIEDLLDQDQFLEFDGTSGIEEGDEEIRNDVNMPKEPRDDKKRT